MVDVVFADVAQPDQVCGAGPPPSLGSYCRPQLPVLLEERWSLHGLHQGFLHWFHRLSWSRMSSCSLSIGRSLPVKWRSSSRSTSSPWSNWPLSPTKEITPSLSLSTDLSKTNGDPCSVWIYDASFCLFFLYICVIFLFYSLFRSPTATQSHYSGGLLVSLIWPRTLWRLFWRVSLKVYGWTGMSISIRDSSPWWSDSPSYSLPPHRTCSWEHRSGLDCGQLHYTAAEKNRHAKESRFTLILRWESQHRLIKSSSAAPSNYRRILS